MRSRASTDGPRILLLAPNWLGDLVMTTPLIDLLSRARFGPDQRPCSLWLGVRRRWRPLFAHDQRFAGVLPIAREKEHGGVAGVPRLAAAARRLDVDAVLLGPPSLRAALVAVLAGIPLRCGYRTDGRGPLLNAGLPFPGRGADHYSRQLLALGRHLVARLQGEPATAPAPAGKLLPGCAFEDQPGDDRGPALWAVGVGTTYGQAKDWPRRHVVDFAVRAVRERGVRVLLLGSGGSFLDRGDPGLPGEVTARDHPAGPAGIIDMVGVTSLPRAAALLRRAEVFVGNDSGLMHLAAVLGTPTVGLFGSSDPGWTAPLGARARCVVPDGFPCSPCFRRTCNQDRFCLDALEADRVLAEVAALLESWGRTVTEEGAP